MTRENQVVNDELAAVVAQRDALKRDLDEALQRLSISQQMVQAREKERQDILMSYRALNEEKQRSDTGTSRVAMELHTVRAQVFIFFFLFLDIIFVLNGVAHDLRAGVLARGGADAREGDHFNARARAAAHGNRYAGAAATF
jgi:hypothetical protein